MRSPSRAGSQALGMALCQCSSIAPSQCGDGLALWASACQQLLATKWLLCVLMVHAAPWPWVPMPCHASAALGWV